MTISMQLTDDHETRSQSYALETQERLREMELDEYREKVREGIESGPGIPAEAVFARLEAKYQAMSATRGNRI